MSGSSSRDWDMSMSWENIQAPVVPAPAAAIPPLPSVPIPPLPVPSALNGARETPGSKFGGFGAGTSVFSPLAFSTSSSARQLPPIIPVPNVPKGNLATQPPVPSGRQPLNASTNAFSSLTQSTSRFAAPPANSGQKSLFDSASRKQNAFYQPPPPAPAAPFPGFNEIIAAESSGARKDADVEMGQGDDDVESEGGRDREDHEPADEEGLGYSVFGGKPVRSSKRAGTGARTRQAPVEAKKVPPGAFSTEEEHEHEHEPEVAEPPAPAPPRQTRRSAATKTSTAKPPAKSAKAPTTRTRGRVKGQEQELSRSLPGSLMESEDGSADEAEEEDEEDGDRVAPLPPRRQATAADGVQTRRRSSRLTSSEAESRTEKEKEKAPGRTKAAAGAGRKRRS